MLKASGGKPRSWYRPSARSFTAGEPRRVSGPREVLPGVRAARLWALEPGVGLLRRIGRRLDARPVARRGLVDRVVDALALARAHHQHHARAAAGAHDDVRGPLRAVEEVPRPQRALLSLNHERAFTAQHEEVLLIALGVVDAVRLPRREHADVHHQVGELRVSNRSLEEARGAELLV